MNINDIQTANEMNKKTIGINNYNATKDGSVDFSAYVQLNNIQNSQTEQGDSQQQSDENASSDFVKNFQILNGELFNFALDNNGNKFFIADDLSFDINLSDLTGDDIQLFENLIQKTDLAVNSIDGQNQSINLNINGEGTGVSYRSIEVSKTLFSAIDNAFQTGKPVRLDFGQDTSVILKISRDGKISADFIPNEKAMEAVLKNALPQLKAKFDEENLPYKELNYRQYNQQKGNQQEHKEKNKDE